eukprot:4975816-Amphidinium_carterae.2
MESGSSTLYRHQPLPVPAPQHGESGVAAATNSTTLAWEWADILRSPEFDYQTSDAKITYHGHRRST